MPANMPPTIPARRIKPWSISTAVRNPNRLRDFLRVLSRLEGESWDRDSQKRYQIMLIQDRIYGAFNRQFYDGLRRQDIDLLESAASMSFAQAASIFDRKRYQDPSMRGRNSFKPLERFGFANRIGGAVNITPIGRLFLDEESSVTEIFLKTLLKWQLPNPIDARGFPASGGYNIKPFVGVLRLIRAVNRICRERGMNESGLSHDEFGIFALTLIDCRMIEKTARDIVNCRIAKQKDLGRLRENFDLKNTRDYADNAVRYFRMTGLLRVRGGGWRIDIEPLRAADIDALLAQDDAKPLTFSYDQYAAFLAAIDSQPLPWQTPETQRKSLALLKRSAREAGVPNSTIEEAARAHPTSEAAYAPLQKILFARLREQERARLRQPSEIRAVAAQLRRLQLSARSVDNRPLELERLATEALRALNDALSIESNSPRGANNEPLAVASGGKADIECFYNGFAAICEVTLLRNRGQWHNEGQPVMRHLRDFESRADVADAFCIFVAPSLHRDTVNTFWFAVRYEFEGAKQKIAPLTIEQFCELLEVCAECREQNAPLNRGEIRKFLSAASEPRDSAANSAEWIARIPAAIAAWKSEILEAR